MVKASAYEHGIEEWEIRQVVAYPALRARLVARKPGARPTLYIGPAAVNEPFIEVIADHAEAQVVVFHAMMLRRQLTRTIGIEGLIDPRWLGRQRPQTKGPK